MKIYKGIGPNEGRAVPEYVAFKYAAQQVGILAFDVNAPEFDEFREWLVEWFFSGNWIEVKEVEET